ncbi:hypothetical protein GPECTOR_23g102 [Gonium pectorale]|uniref:Translin-associated factor X-interacting protein 1 N-terminal domain-containing protein n=1 Tax=Gonium pectorale TaxID=33097 RepID=A0A150GGU7_GONPE|nr:hypothetical protein GPECTOR_23g102 [Gonium pectorale]|eukprot:KXZ49013.1 hypothetical protein GPECTOR_23g102 [Gonium pectorale]
MAPFAGNGARSGKDADLAAAVAAAQAATYDVRPWSRQAKEITSDLTASDKYKSLALHAEVKLAEALERCERVSPTTQTPTGEERPNKLRTAVACQLLGEFAELCGPFSGVLTTLRDELIKGLYSWHYASERGGLAFDQLPWFSVCERLERERETMLEEREGFKAQMQEQQEAVGRIEENMQALRRATEAAQLEAAALRTHLERLTLSEESARLEAKTGREELKKLRKEYLKMKDELEAERSAHTKLQERYAELTEFSANRIEQLSASLAAAQSDAMDARRLAESRMPPELFEKLQHLLTNTQSELEEARTHIRDVEAVNSKLAHRLDVMTPRPVWRKLAEHDLQGGRRTAELVHRVEEKLGRYASELEEAKSRLHLAAALLQPDPAPTEVKLALVTDSSSYFLTEGGDSPEGASASGPAVAEPCGLAAAVPRCLRWAERVPLATLTLEQTEALVLAIWRAKQAMEVSATAGTLQSFIYYYFNQQGLANAETAQLSYSLYHACCVHSKASPLVRTFWLVMTGQVAETAVVDQRAMVSGLAALLHCLAPQADGDQAAEQALIRASDVSTALERFFPNRPTFRVNKLREALRTQFPGDDLPLEGLLAALQPHGLAPPPPSAAPSTARMARYRPDVITRRGLTAVGPLASALIGQHIDEIHALCLEVATQLADVPPPPGGAAAVDGGEAIGDNPAEISAIVDKLGGLLGQGRAVACVMAALGFATGDPGGGSRAGGGGDDDEDSGGGGGGGGGADVVMPTGLIVDTGDMTQWILRGCLVKPAGNYDVTSALQWATGA